MLVFTAGMHAKLSRYQLGGRASSEDHSRFLLLALYILIFWNSIGESLMTLLLTFLIMSVRVYPWKASPYAQLNAKVERVNLSNLYNFPLFANNNSGKSSHRKLRNCWGKKTLMGPYIVCKVLSF